MSRSDFATDEKTRLRMKSVKTRDTAPELAVQSILYKLGYDFVSQRTDLPGKPDFTLSNNKAVFVHGCFWHGHNSCDKGIRRPQRNKEYWEEKIKYNISKDMRVADELRRLKWQVIVIWECETEDLSGLESRLKTLLGKMK